MDVSDCVLGREAWATRDQGALVFVRRGAATLLCETAAPDRSSLIRRKREGMVRVFRPTRNKSQMMRQL